MMEYNAFEIGPALEQIRKDKKMTREDVSAVTGLSVSSIKQIEYGIRNLSMRALYLFMEAYECDANTLLSLGMMTINALVSSDSVLIPVQAAYLPVKGLQQLIKTISMVKKRLNRRLTIEGILLTMVDFRTNYAKDIAALVQETYGSQIAIFKNVIPMSVKAAETSAEGISIYTHCPKGKVSMAYMNLTQEVMSDEK